MIIIIRYCWTYDTTVSFLRGALSNLFFFFAGCVRTTRGHHMRQDVRELGLGPYTGGRSEGHQAHRTAAGSEQSELQLLRVLYPVSDTHHGPSIYFKQQNPLQQYRNTRRHLTELNT